MASAASSAPPVYKFRLMANWLHMFRSHKIGLALSGGGIRGLAHVGVIKALTEAGIQPVVVAGVSAGSIVGAGFADGLDWRGLTAMARSVFWPSLLHGGRLERFCAEHLSETFAKLSLPFAAVATAVPERQVITPLRGIWGRPSAPVALFHTCAVRWRAKGDGSWTAASPV